MGICMGNEEINVPRKQPDGSNVEGENYKWK
jgi:hypothetical protein